MRTPAWTDFFLDAEGEWSHGGSDVSPRPAPPRAVCAVRVLAGGGVEPRALTPSGAPYLDKLLALHPFDHAEVCAYIVSVHGRDEVIVWARSKFEAARCSGLAPDGLGIRER